MQLSVRDLADAAGIPTSAIHRWSKRGHLPGIRVLDEERFNPLDVLDWSLRMAIPLRGVLFEDVDELRPDQAPLAAALEAGGTASLPAGPLGHATVEALEPLLPELDASQRVHVLEPIRKGQAPGWICPRDFGIALPRAARAIVCDVEAPLVRVFYPQSPGASFPSAISQQPVVAWVWLLTPTPAAHLILLERLAKLLFGLSFVEPVASQQPARALVHEARRREAALLESLQTHGEGDGEV